MFFKSWMRCRCTYNYVGRDSKAANTQPTSIPYFTEKQMRDWQILLSKKMLLFLGVC